MLMKGPESPEAELQHGASEERDLSQTHASMESGWSRGDRYFFKEVTHCSH